MLLSCGRPCLPTVPLLQLLLQRSRLCLPYRHRWSHFTGMRLSPCSISSARSQHPRRVLLPARAQLSAAQRPRHPPRWCLRQHQRLRAFVGAPRLPASEPLSRPNFVQYIGAGRWKLSSRTSTPRTSSNGSQGSSTRAPSARAICSRGTRGHGSDWRRLGARSQWCHRRRTSRRRRRCSRRRRRRPQ